ncbi:MAG: sugar ABC transporter substrate-binding protein [bacterium]
MRKIISSICILLSIVSLVTLSGCSSKTGDADKITISIACTYSPTDTGCRIIDKSIDNFMKANPDIRVKKIWFTKDYYPKLATMIAGGTPPDIFRVSPDMVPMYIQKGALMPLDDFITGSKTVKLEAFYPQVLHKYRFDGKIIGRGKIYGFGTDWSPDCTLFYNKDIFDKARLPYPDRSPSWEEFKDMALKLTSGQGRKRIFGGLINNVSLLVYQSGGQVFSKDGKKCLLDSPEAIAAFQYLVDLRIKDKVMPSYADMQESSQLELFQTGRLAMFLSGRYYVPVVGAIVKDFKWGVAPGLHSKKRVNIVTGPCGWVMSSKVKHPEAAWKLMEHLVVGDCEKDLAKAGYNIPVIKSIAESDMFLTNPNHPAGFNKVFMDEVQYTVPSPLTPYLATDRWQSIVKNELDLAYLGKQSAGTAAVKATKKINQLLGETVLK